MKLKQFIGIALMGLMTVSLWNKLEESLKEAEEPLAMGVLIILIILILIVLVVRVTRSD